MSKPIPEGYHAVTPSFTFEDSQKAIDFYKKAFGAEVLDLMKSPDGRGIMHATMQIGTQEQIRKGAEAFFAQMAKK